MALKIPISEKDHILGDPKAPVVLVEYGDYECPHCGRAFPMVKRVEKHFGQKLAFVFRNFPLRQIHPNAEAAAETAEFAGDNGKFWEMHDAIFQNQESLGPEMLASLAMELKLSEEKWREALENGKYTSKVKSDFMGGARSGVNGTPTFFINGERFEGLPEFEELVKRIDAKLGG